MRQSRSHVTKLLPVLLTLMLACNSASARFHEGWETARVGFYSLDEGIEESSIQADEGTWLADSAVGAEGEAGVSWAKGRPQRMQKRASGGCSAPQLGQRRGSAAPQCMQKRALGGLSAWQ